MTGMDSVRRKESEFVEHETSTRDWGSCGAEPNIRRQHLFDWQ